MCWNKGNLSGDSLCYIGSPFGLDLEWNSDLRELSLGSQCLWGSDPGQTYPPEAELEEARERLLTPVTLPPLDVWGLRRGKGPRSPSPAVFPLGDHGCPPQRSLSLVPGTLFWVCGRNRKENKIPRQWGHRALQTYGPGQRPEIPFPAPRTLAGS